MNSQAAVSGVANEDAGGGGGTMPEEVFKWMAHSVNQDFLGMGYPAILTKSGEQEFVNLCPLIRNCSSVLTLVKARRRTVSSDTTDRPAVAVAAAAVAKDRHSGSSSGGVCGVVAAAAPSTVRRKRRRWGLFSSKQQQQRRKGGRQHQQPTMQPTQPTQQQQAAPGLGDATRDSLHESMARKMRKDTERIIRRTACLDQRATNAATAAAAEACPPSPYLEGSREQADFAFMHSTWRSFRKLAHSRIVECAEAAKRSEELQREVASLTAQVERLRAHAAAAAEDGTNASSCGSTGRLQRVGGFLRRAVSKERLTFGRRSKPCGVGDESATPSEGGGGGSSKRSRSCSLPPLAAAAAAASAPVDLEAELRRMRLEFDRRERLLLSEREKLRQANSKLNFRVQHLSCLAAVAAKQNSNSGGCGGGVGSGGSGGSGGGIGGKDAAELHTRRLERRAAGLQKEVTSLKQELNEKIDSLTGIGAAVAKLSRASAAVAASADGAESQQQQQLDPAAELPTDAARVPHLVDAVCQAALTRLRQLQQSRGEALAKAAALGDCLELVRRRLGLTRAAVDNSRALEVELDAIAARLASATLAAASAATSAATSTTTSAATSVGGRSLSASGRRWPSLSAAAATTSAAALSMASSAADASAVGCAGGDHQKLELRDRIIGKLTAMLRERQDEVRRLKDISLSCQDVSSVATASAGQRYGERRSQATDARSNIFR